MSPSGPLPRSIVFMTARRKRHSTDGWMAVHFSLITAWMRVSNSSMLRLTAIEKSGRTSRSRKAWVGIEIARPVGGQLEHTDDLVLVVERRHHDAAHAGSTSLSSIAVRPGQAGRSSTTSGSPRCTARSKIEPAN